ncbi:hypothetical protein J2S34_001520 [Nitrobacter winogradskyi]|uniref:Uncharacterized protein n=1 Tax=Nitrobacter winogradskyi TaxID=913 RepID=A0ACC6AHV8_NITWI|nr:hypothetical protein [Nitrobacter winogradskyi]
MGVPVRMCTFVSLTLDVRVRVQHVRRFPNFDL